VGSISHCEGLCAAVVAPRDELTCLGFDVELSDPLPDDITRLIYSAEEAEHFAGLPAFPGFTWGKLAFSAKEAFFKSYYPPAKEYLDFLDAAVSFSLQSENMGQFSISIRHKFKPFFGQESRFIGRWFARNELICTGVTLA